MLRSSGRGEPVKTDHSVKTLSSWNTRGGEIEHYSTHPIPKEKNEGDLTLIVEGTWLCLFALVVMMKHKVKERICKIDSKEEKQPRVN